MTSIVSSRRSFCSIGDVGAEPGRVGQRARLLDRAQEGGDAAVVAAQLEDLFDHGAVLARQLLGVLVVGMAVVDLLHVDAQRLALALVAGDGGAGESAVQADHGRRGRAAARVAALDHLGDDADAAELAVAAGQQEDRSSSPMSIGRVAETPGKTIASSSGIRR